MHKYSFRDVDKLQNESMDKKRRIISKAIYIQLVDYGPSNEYVSKYSDTKTIRLYRKLTENRIDIETLYLQMHNQLSKQDTLKRTKHANSLKHNNITTKSHSNTYKLKVLTVNVKGLNKLNKRDEIFNLLKAKKCYSFVRRNSLY